MKPVGTVTIPLEDYQEMRDHYDKAELLGEKTKRAAKEMAVFLSFMATRTDVGPYIKEFNKQSTTASIELEDNRARIKFKDDKD